MRVGKEEEEGNMGSRVGEWDAAMVVGTAAIGTNPSPHMVHVSASHLQTRICGDTP